MSGARWGSGSETGPLRGDTGETRTGLKCGQQSQPGLGLITPGLITAPSGDVNSQGPPGEGALRTDQLCHFSANQVSNYSNRTGFVILQGPEGI